MDLENAPTKVKHLAMIAFVVMGTISFLMADGIAVLLFLQRNKFHLETHPLVLLMPGYLFLPSMVGVVAYKKIRRSMPGDDSKDKIVLDIRLWIALLVAVAYSALLLSMALVAGAAH